MDDWAPPNSEYPPPKPGEPPLHRAARLGDAATIRELVAAGHDIEEVFDIGLDPGARESPATPLMVAAGSGDGATVETVALLVSLGADPARVVKDHSAATFAASGLGWNYRPGGDADRLRFLLERGSPLSPSPRTASRILCDVARAGDPERLSVLLAHGLPPDGYWDADEARERYHRMMASLERMPNPVEYLLSDENRRAVEENIAQLQKESFDRACSAPSEFEIPLFNAAASGSAACVRLLLDAGATATRRDSSDQTAIFGAASPEVVRRLMACGLSLEDRNYLDWTPLMAAISDHEEGLPVVRALIECGADVNATHDQGYTVFMGAVGSNRHPDAMRLLVRSGADPHAVTELGYNAFHAAIDVDFEANAEESVRDTLGYLKELGVDIEHRNNFGQTPLARAVEHGSGIEVQVLCELGADPNVVCPMHRCGAGACRSVDRPLLIAAADGPGVDQDVKIRALLEAGADPLATDDEGYTALTRVVAKLCRDADDYEGAFGSFYQQLHELRLGQQMPDRRADFVAAAESVLRPFVEKFAAAIPIGDTYEFEAQWRQQRMASIVCLAAYEGWARHERTKADR